MSIADEVQELMVVARKFERPAQLIDVAKSEIVDLYIPELRHLLGEDADAYRRLLGMAVRVEQDSNTLMARVKDMRVNILGIASKIAQSGGGF